MDKVIIYRSQTEANIDRLLYDSPEFFVTAVVIMASIVIAILACDKLLVKFQGIRYAK